MKICLSTGNLSSIFPQLESHFPQLESQRVITSEIPLRKTVKLKFSSLLGQWNNLKISGSKARVPVVSDRTFLWNYESGRAISQSTVFVVPMALDPCIQRPSSG
jgi:hypothetical protein